MRISDWSSDVCSSDLLTSTWVKQPAASGALSASMRSSLSSMCKQMALELGPMNVRVNQIQPGATATGRMTDIVKMMADKNGTTPEQEIGRASCRERVCTDV